MRKQLLVLRVLSLTALCAAMASAAPPPGHGPDAEHGKGPTGKAAGEDKDKDKDKAKGEKEAKGDKDGDKDKDKDDDKDKEHARKPGANAFRELLAEEKAGKISKDEVKKRVNALHDQLEERAKEHREDLKKRFGSLLATPAAREELEHHGRRIARLERAQLVVDLEVKKDKDKLSERITKLIAREDERHEKAMERLKAAQPAAATAAPGVPAAPATAPAAPAAPAKGGE